MRCPVCKATLQHTISHGEGVCTVFSVNIACPECKKPIPADSAIYAELPLWLDGAMKDAIAAAPVRFWGHLRPIPPLVSWHNITLLYMAALQDSQIEFQACGYYGVDYGSEAPWLVQFDPAFRRRLRHRFINIACGFGGDFEHPHTTLGGNPVSTYNIAITGSSPRQPNMQELGYISKFDEVWLTQEDDPLRDVLKTAWQYVPPLAHCVESALRELIR